ncbi:Dicer-like protein 1 [Coemansia sp. RSA 1935]|nr:Dicer-like protein 1 [Coemansia sp. RSA 562]KAJ2188651.1 Dicer-like protein 1 [Coemansia sp. RSA 532]KAJ2250589.1 Dicer-like protein 1 [Coemansia sp. RSA 475]KAJ2429589.1 Dicer-like protein 1 [Coemansia sp. RSA 2524]KAJ2537153.1 Dicer-like protein 1 [Coemansia sp. RSA 1935]
MLEAHLDAASVMDTTLATDTEPATALEKSGLTPRDYQLALFHQALRSNSIVMLETGTGKTLVAVMLIEWFAQRAAAGSGRRKVRVFLNNTVALVHQQARVIGDNTAQTVHAYVGAMGLDEWDETAWTRTWARADVLVMTHQVLLNALRSGHARISDIDLLVFDEAHHARGSHPYMLIMREFYDHCAPNDRPHIFGMTASPLNAHQSAQASVHHLQASLDASMCTVDLTADQSSRSKQIAGSDQAAGPSAVCYEYALPPAFAPTPLTTALEAACGSAKVVVRGLRTAPVILALLGPFGVDQMWLYYLRQWHRAAALRPAPSRNAVASALPDATAADDPLLDIAYLKSALELARAHCGALLDAVSDNEQMLATETVVHPVPQLRALGLHRRPWADVRAQLSPQVNRLLGILLQWRDRPTELRGIVFVGRRITVVLLAYVVTLIAEFDFVRADVLLGAALKQSGSIDRPIRSGSVRTANQLTLADFADGRLNLVFATQVAEEGVDIQPCNLVIRFDMPKTATSMIQSRGRARMPGSQFIVMVPQVDPELKQSLDVPASAAPLASEEVLSAMDADASELIVPESQVTGESQTLPEHQGSYTDYLRLVRLEDCLRDWCRAEALVNPTTTTDSTNIIVSSGPAHQEYGRMHYNLRIDDSPSTELEEMWVEQGDKQGRIYTIVSTQARITYMSAVPTVHSYVQHLPQDQLCKLQPIFDFEQVAQPKQPTVSQTKKTKKAKIPTHNALFRCTITLPSNAAVRRVAGPLMPNKRLAKQAAAYRAAKKLHQLGAIDDNLSPIADPEDEADQAANKDTNAKPTEPNAKPASRKVKGARSSTDTYDIAVAPAFVQPKALTQPDMESGEMAAKYSPRTWHLYLLSLHHPSTDSPSQIVFASAHRMPADISVPLFVNQFNAAIEPRDTSATIFRPKYLGSQVLDQAQFDILAQFSSKIFTRMIFMMLTWNELEVGSLLAPLNAEGTGIDFEFAQSCFDDRSIVYQDSTTDYSSLVGTLIMDALDHGRVKIVEQVCDTIDIYSDLRAYHSKKASSDLLENPQPDGMDSDDGCMVAKKKQKGAKTRLSVKTMAKWTDVKRINRIRPAREIATGVPLFKVRNISLVYNYLTIVPQSILSSAYVEDAQETSNAAKVATGAAFPDGLYTSPFFCAREPMDSATIANLSLLPAFFMRLNQLLLAYEVKKKLALPVQVQTVREAITSSSANTDVCYERLETLGDSVLKYIASVMLFVAYPDAHEGILTTRRGRIICNANLFDLSTRFKLPPYIISQTFVKRDVRLPGRGWHRMPFIPAKWICMSPFFKALSSTESSNTETSEDAKSLGDADLTVPKKQLPTEPIVVGTTRMLSEKTVADIIESLLGASVCDGGINGALAAARALGVVDNGWTCWSSFASVWRSNMAARKRKMVQLSNMRTETIAATTESQEANDLLQEMKLDQSDVLFGLDLSVSNPQPGSVALQHKSDSAGLSDMATAQIEDTLGYTFNDRALLVEALTHCSSLDVTSSSYQRLEFLGDAVLDFFLTKRYYDHQPPLNPHRMTLVKHVAASNDLFAIVLVCNGLQKHVCHGSVTVRDAIHDYELRLKHARKVWSQRHSNEEKDHREDSATMERPAKSRRTSSSSEKSSIDIYSDLPPEVWDAVRAPKVLGDILESLVGAVFVDSGMSHETAKSVYERVLSPFLDRFVDSGKLSLHPVIQTLLVCQGWGCDAVSWENGTDSNPLEYTNRYVCHVVAHGQRISTSTGDSPRHAKYNAANALLTAIGASAPNALDGDLNAVHNLSADKATSGKPGETALDKLLKPICTCAERRLAEAEQRAAAEEKKKRMEIEQNNTSGGIADAEDTTLATDVKMSDNIEEGELV